MDVWDPARYERFKRERAQPFFDLMSLLRPRPGMRVVDLGCGTGELTRELHLRLGAARTVGIDRSPAMLERSEAFAAEGLSFELGDLRAFRASGAWDLVLSNAALHWVEDHPALLGRLFEALAPLGQLAVQLPANQDQPTYLTALEVASEPPFGALSGPPPQTSVLAPEGYARLLYRLGFREQHVRLQVYGHELASREEVLEWVAGTTLTPYEGRLGPELFARFRERYRERLLSKLPDERPYFFPFKRLLLWAMR